MTNITIIGAGAWGTALAYALRSTSHQITLWSKNQQIVDDLNNNHQNSRYALGKNLPDIIATSDLAKALIDSKIIINALPSYAIKETFKKTITNLNPDSIVINASKGIDSQTHQQPYQIFKDILPDNIHYFSLSGPGFATDVLNNNPTSVNVAGHDHGVLKHLQEAAKKNNFFIAFSSDIIGTEWGGIYKNIVSIASGLAKGLGFGENTSALVFSAGFREMVESGIALGANLETFYEPSGVGDLMLSTSSMKSRNYSFGFHLAREKQLDDVFSKLAGVAEGYYALKSITHLFSSHHMTLPLSNMLNKIINQNGDPAQCFNQFLEEHFA